MSDPTNPETTVVEPLVTERSCGGWLAVSPVGFPLRIGVTGDSDCAGLVGIMNEDQKANQQTTDNEPAWPVVLLTLIVIVLGWWAS